MKNFENLQQRFLSALLEMPYAKLHSGRKWVMFRCPYCYDSKKHIDTTHFNVSIPQTDNDIIYMKCFQPECEINSGKVVKENDLKIWGIYDQEIIQFVKSLNNKKNKNKSSDTTFVNYKKFVNIPQKDDLSKEKLEYINKRLGIKLIPEDLIDLKIVLSFEKFLQQNNLRLKDEVMSEKMAWYLENNAIAFLSKDGTHLLFRDIHQKKYISYNISGTDDGMKFYAIPTEIDLLKKVNVYLAEGTFDILSAYYNLDITTENNLFIAVTGASYDYIVKQLIRHGLIDAEFHIFSDNDVSVEYYQSRFNQIGMYKFHYPINIYYNKLGKDIGVPKNEIELTSIKIK